MLPNTGISGYAPFKTKGFVNIFSDSDLAKVKKIHSSPTNENFQEEIPTEKKTTAIKLVNIIKTKYLLIFFILLKNHYFRVVVDGK